MKAKAFLTTLLVGAACHFAPQISRALDIDVLPPVVVKTVPESGAKDVASGEVEIKVTFSKEMMDDTWSWSAVWNGSTPEIIGQPHFLADHRTCVVKVKLQPGTAYGYWLNSQNYSGFHDALGHVAVPYMLVFRTKPE
jgi:hypothetical protein